MLFLVSTAVPMQAAGVEGDTHGVGITYEQMQVSF